jgi:hypothetical protein
MLDAKQEAPMREFRDIHLFARLTVYYLVWAGIFWIAYSQVPDLHRHLPLGVVENLISAEDDPTGFIGVQIHASNVTNELGGIAWLVAAILGSVAIMVPVSWVYMEIRQRSKMDQSLLETLIILPIVITGIVLMVHNSLALAFSLAGVMAGVRFRNAMKSTADSVFIFMAVGVGLSCGIGMLMIAAVMSMIFNYTFLALWALNYGGYAEAKTYMRSARHTDEEKDTGVFK